MEIRVRQRAVPFALKDAAASSVTSQTSRYLVTLLQTRRLHGSARYEGKREMLIQYYLSVCFCVFSATNLRHFLFWMK